LNKRKANQTIDRRYFNTIEQEEKTIDPKHIWFCTNEKEEDPSYLG
jgi:hypothetical protein